MHIYKHRPQWPPEIRYEETIFVFFINFTGHGCGFLDNWQTKIDIHL
jgi:hypothetical protein